MNILNPDEKKFLIKILPTLLRFHFWYRFDEAKEIPQIGYFRGAKGHTLKEEVVFTIYEEEGNFFAIFIKLTWAMQDSDEKHYLDNVSHRPHQLSVQFFDFSHLSGAKNPINIRLSNEDEKTFTYNSLLEAFKDSCKYAKIIKPPISEDKKHSQRAINKYLEKTYKIK